MTREEALKLLSWAPYEDRPARLNPALTQKEAVDIVREAISEMKPGGVVGDIMTRRVWQVVKNQRRPCY